MNEDEVEEKFNKLMKELTDDEWWKWVRGWYDEDLIAESYENWDEDTKADTIKDLEGIISRRESKSYPCISLSKEDLIYWAKEQKLGGEVIKKIEKLDNWDMGYYADKIGDNISEEYQDAISEVLDKIQESDKNEDK